MPALFPLVLLVIQNSSIALLTAKSRSSASYLAPAAVFVAECMKALLSLFMVTQQERVSPSTALGKLCTEQKQDVLNLAVPSVIYAIQNNLLYIALSNLSAPTYQVTYQLKILSTALFSVFFFNRNLSLNKWISLFILTIGVAVVQLEGVDLSSESLHSQGNQTVGVLAILAACLGSGLAGCWFESVLLSSAASKKSEKQKSKPPSLWVRNLQMAVPSIFFSLAGIFFSPQARHQIFSHPTLQFPSSLLQGFDGLVWFVILNQAVGGILVALVVREAGSVAKGFATSISIILSTLINSYIESTTPGKLFVAGTTLVITATSMFALA